MKKFTGGIYVIRRIETGHSYIGSSTQIEVRFAQHRRALRSGNHHAKYLQRAWTKYGESAFAFEIIEVIESPTRDILFDREQYFFNVWKPVYNASLIAKSPEQRSDKTKCKKLLHEWIPGQRMCKPCYKIACDEWIAAHPDEHKKHRRESAMRKKDAQKPDRVRRSPAGERKGRGPNGNNYYVPKGSSDLCKSGLHPKDGPGRCPPCYLENRKRSNAKRPTTSEGRRANA